MSKKHQGGPGPVPKGNRSPMGPTFHTDPPTDEEGGEQRDVGTGGAASQEQDEKRRLGNFETTGEHAIQQPGGKQGSDH